MLSTTGFAMTVALLATTAYHLGLIVEKRALRTLPAIDARHPVSLLRVVLTARAWLAGFALMLCGFGLQVVALGLAPVSVIQPVLASGVVILVVASRILLRERLTRTELACVLGMAVAIAMIAISASGASTPVGHHVNALLLAEVAGPTCLAALAFGLGALRSVPTARHRLPSVGVSYGLASGLLYGVATLAAKALAGIVAAPDPRSSVVSVAVAVLRSPYPYLAIGLSAAGMVIFQTGLQRCRVSIVGPVSNITGSAFFLAAGTWLFGEHLPGDPARLGLRLAGMVGAAVVVVLLARRPAPQEVAEGSPEAIPVSAASPSAAQA